MLKKIINRFSFRSFSSCSKYGLDKVGIKNPNTIFYNLTHDELLPLKTMHFRGKEFKCMNNPVKFFERYYGKDWKTPR